MSRRAGQKFSKEDIQMSNKKDSHQRNAYQNHKEIPLHTDYNQKENNNVAKMWRN